MILGNTQLEGLNYHETFAPVGKMVTVRTLLIVTTARNWDVHQMDVYNTFIHGDLSEEVYIRLFPGFLLHMKAKYVAFINLCMD